jgi:hypothetical protein
MILQSQGTWTTSGHKMALLTRTNRDCTREAGQDMRCNREIAIMAVIVDDDEKFRATVVFQAGVMFICSCHVKVTIYTSLCQEPYELQSLHSSGLRSDQTDFCGFTVVDRLLESLHCVTAPSNGVDRML